MKRNDLTLTLVTQLGTRSLQNYLTFIDYWIDAGVTAVQLREKNLEPLAVFEFAQALHHLLQARKVPLIINDSLSLCLALNTEGLHLGQDDGDVWQAREQLGTETWLGLSTNSLAQVQAANQLPIDYIGVGAIFPTQNKPDSETIWGVQALEQAVQASIHPVVAIGGIDESNADTVRATGVSGIAAIGAFHKE